MKRSRLGIAWGPTLRGVFMLWLLFSIVASSIGFGSTIAPASASATASAGATDEARCSSAAYSAAGNWHYVQKCYIESSNWTTLLAAKAGLSTTSGCTVGGGTFALQAQWATSSTTAITIGNAGCEALYVGSITSPGGSIGPVYTLAVVARSFCLSGANACNISGGNATAVATMQGVYTCQNGTTTALWSGSSIDMKCSVYYGTVANQAAAEAISWPPDWFTGGTGFSPHECVSMSISGSPSTVNDGQSLTITTTGTPAAGTVIQYKLRPSSSWVTLSTVPGAVVVPISGSPLAISGVQTRCITTGSPTYVYLILPASGSNSWSSTAPSVGACSQAVLTWPAGDVASSTSAVFSYTIPSGVSGITLKHAVIDPTGSPSSPTGSTTWTTDLSSQAGPYTGTITATVVAGVSMGQVWWQCIDGQGISTGFQYSAQYTYASALYGESADRDCWSGVGIGASPSSWVVGIVRGVGCVALWLVVPSSSDLDDLQDEWSGTWLGRFLSPVTETITGFYGLSSSWATTGADAACYGPSVDVDLGSDFTGHLEQTWFPFNACADGEASPTYGTNDVMHYVRIFTLFASRFIAALWLVFRLRNIYLGMVAPA